MQRIRWNRGILAGALITSLLVAAGCGGSGNTEKSDPAPASGTAQKEPIKLEFWTMANGEKQEAGEMAIINEWNQLHPDIQVERVQLGWGDYQQKMVGAVQAGDPPDISGGDAGIPFFMNSMGAAEPIDDVVAKLKQSPDWADINPYAYEKFNVDGHYIGFTWGIDGRSIFYRKDIFEAKGIKPPKTWEDLLAAAKALNDPANEFYGIVFPAKAGTYDTDQFWMTLALQAGGGVADANGKPTIGSKANLEALKFELELAKYAPEGIAGYTWDEVHRIYQQGKAAMVMNGGWFIEQMKSEAPEIYAKTDVLPTLTGPSGKPVSVGFYNGWMVYKGGKHVKESKEFLAFALQKQQLSKIYKTNLGGVWPIYKSLAADPMYQAHPMLANFAKAVAETSVDYYWPNNKSANGIAALGTGLSDFIVNPAVAKTMTPEDALKNGAAKLEKNF